MENSVSSNEPLTRKQAKKASKRKKLEALLRIAALNDKDRQAQQSNQRSPVNDVDYKEMNGEQEQSSDIILHYDTIESTVTSNISADGPSPKRHKPDTFTSDEETSSSSPDSSTSIPFPNNGSCDLRSLFQPVSNGLLPQFLPQTHQSTNPGVAAPLPYCPTIFQQNIAVQVTKQQQQQLLPHLINGLAPLHVIPTILNVPAILGNTLRENLAQRAGCVPIALLPTICGVFPFGSPFLLPNPNVRGPSFPIPGSQLNNKSDAPDKVEITADEDLQNLRKSLKARYKEFRTTPHFYLASAGETASLSTPEADRVPIFPSDIQRLILRAALQTNAHIESRCGYFKNITKLSGVKLLLLEGVSLGDIQGNPDISSLSENIFPVQMECIMPAAYQGAFLEELASVPLNPQDRLNLINKYGSLEAALRHSRQIFRVLRAFFPISDKSPKTTTRDNQPAPPGEMTIENESRTPEIVVKPSSLRENSVLHSGDKFPRTHLLLSAWQMIEEGYPLPIKAKSFQQFDKFAMTKNEYKEVTPTSPMYGVDCEMCLTTLRKHELTRISVINENLEVVYDTLVMPENKIINYLTEFSGITAAMMKGVKTTLRDVQDKLREILEPDAILVGQSLNMDLIALQLMHPYVIDTSVIFNLFGERGRKSKLRHLAKAFLKEDIQGHSDGHNPIEDAVTALKLVQLKLAKSVEFGDAVLSQLRNIPFSQELKLELEKSGDQSAIQKSSKRNRLSADDLTLNDEVSASVFRYLNRQTVSIIGHSDTIEEYNKYIYVIKYWESQSSKRPKLHRPNTVRGIDEQDIIDKAVKCMSQSFCTIAHVKLDQSVSELISVRDKEMTERFNSMINEFNAGVPENSLVLVVMGGNFEGANGAVYLALRKRKFHPTRKIPPRCD